MEARVPCPVCRGPIHPVAGRCKHCKLDLTAWRAGTPQAPSALPSLGNRTANDRAVAGPRGPGRRVGGPSAAPVGDPVGRAFDLSSPIPSSSIPTARTSEPPVSWAIIVIAVSAIAIVIATGVIASQLR